MNFDINYVSLLGKRIEEVEEILANFSEKKKKDLKNFAYLSVVDQGISFAFKDQILNSIYFYNEGIQGFRKYKGVIPYVVLEMKNKEVVELFGDTNNKGGGGLNPIWLVYNRLGIEITFVGKNWTDIDNPIAHVCVFEKDVTIPENCSTCTKPLDNTGNSFKCNINGCEIVKYCSNNCMKVHIDFHLKHCQTNTI